MQNKLCVSSAFALLEAGMGGDTSPSPSPRHSSLLHEQVGLLFNERDHGERGMTVSSFAYKSWLDDDIESSITTNYNF